MKFQIPQQVFKNLKNHQISRKSVHWEPSSSRRTDCQRDTINLIVTFRSSAKRLTFGNTTSYRRNFFKFSGYCL